MAHLNHFTYGLLTPGVAYVLSVLGSLLGLICTARVRTAPTRAQKAWWLLLAAWAIGGTGIWSMHFMAMLGFSVRNAPIRYDVGITVLSAALAILVVGVGLFIAGFGRRSGFRVVIGGLLTGVGVAGMHYTGMAAMHLDGVVHYDQSLVIASVIIAVVAATVALWFTVNVRQIKPIIGAGLLMGVAVCGMHYTGMAAMSVDLTTPTFDIAGASVSTLLIPIGVSVLLVVGFLIFAIGAAPSDEDFAARAYLDQIQAARQEAQDQINQRNAPEGASRRRGSAIPPRATNR